MIQLKTFSLWNQGQSPGFRRHLSNLTCTTKKGSSAPSNSTLVLTQLFCEQYGHKNPKHVILFDVSTWSYNELYQWYRKQEVRFECTRAILCNKDYYVLNNCKEMDEPLTLKSTWCSCIKRDLSKISFFWPAMLPNISGCLNKIDAFDWPTNIYINISWF